MSITGNQSTAGAPISRALTHVGISTSCCVGVSKGCVRKAKSIGVVEKALQTGSGTECIPLRRTSSPFYKSTLHASSGTR